MTTRPSPQSEAGFTLIELLTIIAIIGVLASMAIGSYRVYVANAGYAVVQSSLDQSRIALQAALSEPDLEFDPVDVTQSTQGPLLDSAASTLFPQFQVARGTRFMAYYDPSCDNAGCTQTQMTVRHCRGSKYSYWAQFGDGTEALVQDIPGNGC